MPSLDDLHLLPEIELGLCLWQGRFEHREDTWLRWVDVEGRLIATGDEVSFKERQRAQQERERADRLTEKLRRLGIDPDE